MATTTLTPFHPIQIIVTLDNTTKVTDIKKALKLIRGVASVRMARVKNDNQISPSLYARMKKARKEYEKGETIACNTPDEMQKYFDSL